MRASDQDLAWICAQKSQIIRHRGLEHPLFDELPTLCREPRFIAIAMGQLYHLVLGFPFHIAGAISTTRDENVLAVLARNLYAEVGGADGEAHIDLFRRILRATGVSIDRPHPKLLWPETVALESSCSQYYRHPNLGLKLGSLFAFEAMSSPMVSHWVKGLRNSSNLKEWEIEFFVVHVDIEKEHVEDIQECAAMSAGDEDFRGWFEIGAVEIMSSLERLWDRMLREGRAIAELVDATASQ
ncbi:MAG: iron-containing redox enzyme family protein [Planctomycetaceae bacterium]